MNWSDPFLMVRHHVIIKLMIDILSKKKKKKKIDDWLAFFFLFKLILICFKRATKFEFIFQVNGLPDTSTLIIHSIHSVRSNK